MLKFRFILTLSIVFLFHNSWGLHKRVSRADSLRIDSLILEIQNNWQSVPKTLNQCAQVISIIEEIGDSSFLSLTYYRLGVVHLELHKNYNQTLKYLVRSLTICKALNDSTLLQRCYQTIGNTYTNIFATSKSSKDFNDAELNLKKALEINLIRGKKGGLISVYIGNNYINLSELYLKKGDDTLSMKYASEAKRIYELLNEKSGMLLAIGNMSQSSLIHARKTGRVEDYQASKKRYLEYFEKNEVLCKGVKLNFDTLPGNQKFNTAISLADYFLSLAEINFNLNEKSEFEKCIQLAENYAVKSQQIELLISVYSLKSKCYKGINPKLYESTKTRLFTLLDSAYILEAKKKNEILKETYESTEREIAFTNVENENKLKTIEIAAEKKQGTIKTVLLTISIISIIVFCILLFYLYRFNKELTFSSGQVSQQKELIQIKNQQIIDGINVSKLIQDEILFLKCNLNDYFKEHFLIYLPKDIVSGDFYIVKRIKEYLIVSVVDCTGHGTSGAMMSLHANSLLLSLFESKVNDKSAHYLNKLNEEVKKGFFLNNAIENSSKFGMDIALLIINLEKHEASFSSTNQPLLVIEKNELKELKPAKQTLAYFNDLYQSFEFKITNESKFYLFTDGFYDQKGGSDSKKYLYKNFKNVILKTSHLSFNNQGSELLGVFKEWKNENRQTDDVTLLGFTLKD